MPSTTQSDEDAQARIILGLLESVERDGRRSQRHLAADLGIALGLVNAYLKRCVKKGLIKMKEAPARRYAYYLTPLGFAEKSRLTVDYLSYSFSFFRQARSDCSEVAEQARARGWKRIALAGVSDLADISIICMLEAGFEIVGVVDPKIAPSKVVTVPVVMSFDDIADGFDGVVITDMADARRSYESISDRFGADRVLAPSLLGVRKIPVSESAP